MLNTMETNARRLIIPSSFMAFVAGHERYLTSIKNLCDAFDKHCMLEQNQQAFIDLIVPGVIEVMNQHYERLWKYIDGIEKNEYIKLRSIYQERLLGLTATAPLNRRVYNKPLGYPGDYIMMSYYYDDMYAGETTYEKLMHRYTLSTPLAQAIISRTMFAKQMIIDAIRNSSGKIDVLSIGAGPANEIIDLIVTEPEILGNLTITLVDAEKNALDAVREEVDLLKQIIKTNIQIEYVKINVIDLVKDRMVLAPEGYSLIYSLGLFDYLSDRASAKTIENLFSHLKTDGKLFISNYSKNIELRAYLEFLGEWQLELRDLNDMKAVAGKIAQDSSIEVYYPEDKEQSIYLIAQKK